MKEMEKQQVVEKIMEYVGEKKILKTPGTA